MGHEYEVYSWKKNWNDEYEYAEVYKGDSYRQALKVMRSEKKAGVGCVKLEWR